MPWKEQSVAQQRMELVVRARRKEAPVAALCREYGISRQTGYYWLKQVAQAESMTVLEGRSRRPHHSPHQTAVDKEEAVLAIRDRSGWGARKIRHELKAQQIWLPERTINRILSRQGRVARRTPEGKATRRFARETPNELWQMDFKGGYRTREGWCYPLSVLDDCSRYLVGLWALPNQLTGSVQPALAGLLAEVGVPEQLLLDRGVPWHSQSDHGLTRLSVWLMNQDIALIHGRVRHPQTQGKAERLQGTLGARTEHEGVPDTHGEWEAWVPWLRWEYNWRRPHEALGMQTPGQVYAPVNLRPYQPQPPPFDYGGAPVARVDVAGSIPFRGQRRFVCEALAGEWVKVEELDPLLVVTYRRTLVREIDLRTGKGRSLVFRELSKL
jgi:transposase InsO family protein